MTAIPSGRDVLRQICLFVCFIVIIDVFESNRNGETDLVSSVVVGKIPCPFLFEESLTEFGKTVCLGPARRIVSVSQGTSNLRDDNGRTLIK